jgi:glycosyltransferase involved in cell wall biosynthesis
MTASTPSTTAGAGVLAIVAAHNEADCIAMTLAALARAFPGAQLWVADDGSTDGTAQVAEAAGARVVRSERGASRRNGGVGKGGAVTLAAYAALEDAAARARVGEPSAAGGGALDLGEGDPHREPVAVLCNGDPHDEPVVVLCDGDLGDSAALLGPLVEAVRAGEADLAVAAFARRVGGGLGLAVGFAGWAIRRRCGLALGAPISGQRAVRASVLERALPFAHGFGMEIGMTIDLAREGALVREVELDLSHRATGRTLGGFVHRGRQLIDFMRVYLARR